MTVVLKTLSLYLLLHLTLIKYVNILSDIFISIYYILMENIFLFTDTLYLKNTTETLKKKLIKDSKMTDGCLN